MSNGQQILQQRQSPLKAEAKFRSKIGVPKKDRNLLKKSVKRNALRNEFRALIER